MQAAVKLGKWWVIFAARTKSVFEGEKIVCPQRTKSNIFGYNNDIWYSSADVYYITNAKDGFSLKYILALLNSKLYYFWLYNKGKRKGESLELYYTPLSEIPIKKAKNQQDFVTLVDQILTLKKENSQADTSKLENDIDELVYKLYDLTPEEIEVVKKA
jgi:adenine-specific DNA-methyltransferase